MSRRYWIGVASRDHVRRGLAGGFAQLCHGKAAPLRRMAAGDGLIYYSPVLSLEGREPCQRFTAVGQATDDRVYPFRVSADFEPYRRNIAFWPAEDAEIRPLLGQLAFIADPARWGYAFRFGHLEIGRADFLLIARAMQATLPPSMLREPD